MRYVCKILQGGYRTDSTPDDRCNGNKGKSIPGSCLHILY